MKEFKYTIDGKEYSVVINNVSEDNVADITVNGEEYKVQMEAPAEPEKKKVELGKPVAENETENTATSANINTSNAIKAPRDGKVTAIIVKVGQAVLEDEPLVVIE